MYRRGGSKKDHQNKPAKDESDSSKYAELLVFGYACKLFRDDERAHFHEQGKHLIPWMGDKNIMIDRYDGRGHLHDLSEYDADSWNRDYQLSEEEARIEALCDEERYLALHTDLLEEEARQEEEYKRLSEALADEGTYNAVGYRYSADYYDPSQPTEEEDANRDAEMEPQEDGEEPFVAPPGLIIPPDVELPATIKTHAIIERTANFVCKQGAQFEIVLKAKQAGNSQFDFLRFDHYLNPYYKHILRSMKEGRYTPVSDGQQAQQQDAQTDDSDDDDGDGSYLHPSLMAPQRCSRLEELMKPLRVMDPDHPLAALVRKARQEKNGTAASAASPSPAPVPPPPEEEAAQPAVPTQAEYSTDPNVAAMYYGYCLLPDGSYCLAPPPPPGIDASAYYSSLPHGMMPTPQASSVPPPPGTTPPPEPVPIAPPPAPISISAPPVSISAPPVSISAPPVSISAPPVSISAPPVSISAPPVSISAPPVSISAPPVSISVSAPSPASYAALAVSTAVSTQPQVPVAPAAVSVATAAPAAATPPPTIIPPPPDIQPVIDKLAEYVARNGEKFEASVRAKNDQRFDFLQSWHQFNSYYEFKKHYFMRKEGTGLPEDGSQEQETDGSAIESADKAANEGKLMKASFAPISFAIKAKENDLLPLEKNRVRLDDDSDEERAAEEEGGEGGAVAGAAGTLSGVSTATQVVREPPPAAPPEEKKPALTLEELEAKQAKQKLEARLAAAAREKLAQASKESKEKQLQAERKRKAALFLQTLRDEPPAPPEPEAVSIMAAPPTLPLVLRVPALPAEYQSCEVAVPARSSEAPGPPTSSSSSSCPAAGASRGQERERQRERDRERTRERGRDRDKEKKKKKHKRRSRTRSRSSSRSKTKHGLPTAYRRLRRSRSQSRSPGRRERRTRSPEWRREERERERHGPGPYRPGNTPSLARKRSRSRSPREKRKRKSSRSRVMKASSPSPCASPDPAEDKRRLSTLSASPSPPTSPRDDLQEKDKQVTSAIVSSVQSKITQDLMAKVRAMLAASKPLPSNPT